MINKVILILSVVSMLLISGCVMPDFNTEEYVWENWKDSETEVQK
jgi:hypothetical protein